MRMLSAGAVMVLLMVPAYAQTPNINLIPELSSKTPEEKEAEAIKERPTGIPCGKFPMPRPRPIRGARCGAMKLRRRRRLRPPSPKPRPRSRPRPEVARSAASDGGGGWNSFAPFLY